MLPESSGGRILTETPEISPVKSGLSGCSAAVDLGTTTVAVRLYDLETGIELATDSAWNAQAAYGGDVISRIRHTMDVPDGLGELSRIIRSQVEDMISSALAHCGRDNSSLRHSVLVGNTVMQHIFAHFPVQSIAAAPFEPYTLFDDKPDDTLLGAPLYYAPFVAGYVGGDITAGLLSSGLSEKDGRYLFLDIGANRRKLEEHGIFNKTADYNLRLSELSKKAAGGKAWVAGDISPTGMFLSPLGEASFEELVDIYTEQAAGLEKAGVDLFVIETMMTLSDARAAVLAVRSVSEKPMLLPVDAKHGKVLDVTSEFEDMLAEELDTDDAMVAVKLSGWEDIDTFADCQYMINKPLCIVCDDADILESALRVYQGRALYEGALSEEELLPLCDKYGLII